VAIPPRAAFMSVYPTFERLMLDTLLRLPDDPNGNQKAASESLDVAKTKPLDTAEADELAQKQKQHRRQVARKLLAELKTKAMRDCARRWVMEFEFDRFVADLVHFGGRAIDAPWLVWKAVEFQNTHLIHRASRLVAVELARLMSLAPSQVRVMVAAQRAGILKDPKSYRDKRPRGRVRHIDLDYYVSMILRERIFAQPKSMRELARLIAPHLSGSWKMESLRKRITVEAEKRAPVPSAWNGSLWSQQVEPLRDTKWYRHKAPSKEKPG
jgi:hypothetical protein